MRESRRREIEQHESQEEAEGARGREMEEGREYLLLAPLLLAFALTLEVSEIQKDGEEEGGRERVRARQRGLRFGSAFVTSESRSEYT